MDIAAAKIASNYEIMTARRRPCDTKLPPIKLPIVRPNTLPEEIIVL